MKIFKLKFHEKRCKSCRYHRHHIGKYSPASDCLLLGRILSIGKGASYLDMARYCDGWKRRPKTWDVNTKENPFWHDRYISRQTQINLRKRLKII